MKVYSIHVHVHVHVYVNFEIEFAENKKKTLFFLAVIMNTGTFEAYLREIPT